MPVVTVTMTDQMRSFALDQDSVRVAVGVRFGDGQCAVKFLSFAGNLAVYATLDEVVQTYARDGKTKLVWLG